MDDIKAHTSVSTRDLSTILEAAQRLATDVRAVADSAQDIVTKLKSPTTANTTVTVPKPNAKVSNIPSLPKEIQGLILRQYLEDAYPIMDPETDEEDHAGGGGGRLDTRRYIRRARVLSRVNKFWREEVARFFEPKLQHLWVAGPTPGKHPATEMVLVLTMQAQKRWFAGGRPDDEEARKEIAAYYKQSEQRLGRRDEKWMEWLVDARVAMARLIMY